MPWIEVVRVSVCVCQSYGWRGQHISLVFTQSITEGGKWNLLDATNEDEPDQFYDRGCVTLRMDLIWPF